MKIRIRILPTLLLISSLLVAGLGGYIKYGMLEPLGIYRDESIMAMPFVLYSDKGLQFMVEVNRAALQAPAETEAPSEPASTTAAVTEALEESAPATESATEPSAEAETRPATEPLDTQPATEPEATEPPYVELEDSWFDDALFIGDSRFRGMQNYYRLGKAYYFTSIGMNIYNVFGEWAGDNGHYECSLEETLKTMQFGKVVIGIGLNECNYEHTYIEAGFKRLIDLIQTHQPDAKIILHSVIMVTESHARFDKSYEKENLMAINEIIASFVDNEKIFYIDANEWVVDETGYMPEELTFDGIHFYGTGYIQWAEWIREECGTLEIS